MKIMYDTAQYAGSRIHGTIILLKRQPVLVDEVRARNGLIMVHGNTFGRGSIVVEEELSEFNLTDYRLGYFNKGGTAFYMSRKAIRRDWRQGLRLQNVQSYPTDYDLSTDDIALCLRQRYPSLSGALAKLGEGYESCAWCKDFAVSASGKLSWKAHDCGMVVDDTIVLSNKYKFLANLIKESTHECYEIV